MKARKRWQYYCDHCKKSGANNGAMRQHERRCFRNPKRVCPVCEQSTPEALAEQVEFIKEKYWSDSAGTIESVEKAFDRCPACTLSAIIQAKLIESFDSCDCAGKPIEIDRVAFIEYPYKANLTAYLSDKRVLEFEDCW